MGLGIKKNFNVPEVLIFGFQKIFPCQFIKIDFVFKYAGTFVIDIQK